MSLKELIDEKFRAMGARLDNYVNAHREAHERLADQVLQAAAAVDRRLEGMNELRAQITSERGQYVTRDMLDQRVGANGLRVEELGRRLDQRLEEILKRVGDAERARANLDGRVAMIGIMLLGASIAINLVISLVTGLWRPH